MRVEGFRLLYTEEIQAHFLVGQLCIHLEDQQPWEDLPVERRLSITKKHEWD